MSNRSPDEFSDGLDPPGHWAHGDRSRIAKNTGKARVEFAHVVIDDHTRLAYVEVHPHDRGEIAAAVLARAAAWLREQGCGPVEAVMTDNAFAYINSNAFAQTLTDLSARHIRIPPRTPRWNGEAHRSRATNNRRRPHTSLSDRPPISRVHQDRGQHN